MLTWLFPLLPWLGYRYLKISWLLPFFLLFFIGTLAIFTGKDNTKPIYALKLHSWTRFYFHLVPRAYVLFYLAGSILLLGLLDEASLIDKVFLMLSFGAISILATISMHELLHSFSDVDQLLSRLLTIFIGYSHFGREHAAHHFNEGTHKDGCVAKRGQNVYSFIGRGVISGIDSAFRIEDKILQNNGKSNIHNSIFINFSLSLIVSLIIQEFFGPIGLLAYVVQLFVCIIFTYIIHYVQHYGLYKRQYEKSDDGIAWEYDGYLGNIITLNSSHHAAHHQKQHLQYYLVHLCQNSPKMPSGYSGMVLMALFPPLWFKVMNPRLDAFLNSKINAVRDNCEKATNLAKPVL